MLRLGVAFAALFLPAAALAASEQVSLANSVFVERVVHSDDSGQARRVLEPPRAIGHGDTLVFVVSYRNRGADPASDVVVTNAVPAMVSFAGSELPDVMVSVDGGRSWGALPALSVRAADGSLRPARPSDVTHVRWRLARAIGAGETGQLSFRGIVK